MFSSEFCAKYIFFVKGFDGDIFAAILLVGVGVELMFCVLPKKFGEGVTCETGEMGGSGETGGTVGVGVTGGTCVMGVGVVGGAEIGSETETGIGTMSAFGKTSGLFSIACDFIGIPFSSMVYIIARIY